jgi:hypothetical protein
MGCQLHRWSPSLFSLVLLSRELRSFLLFLEPRLSCYWSHITSLRSSTVGRLWTPFSWITHKLWCLRNCHYLPRCLPHHSPTNILCSFPALLWWLEDLREDTFSAWDLPLWKWFRCVTTMFWRLFLHIHGSLLFVVPFSIFSLGVRVSCTHLL